MKKLIILFLLLIPMYIKADISDLYIDSEIDISGNLIVKEIVKIDDTSNIIKLYYENNLNDKLYFSSGIIINKIGIYDGQDEKNNYIIKDTHDYSSTDTGKEYLIKFKYSNTYYIEYTVLNVCVKHKDSSELYYRFFDKVNYDINNITILIKLPNNSNILYIYKYNYKSDITKDSNNYYIISKIDNLKKNNIYDIRLLYDRDLYSISINKNKITNFNMIKTLNNISYKCNIYNIILIIISLIILVLLLVMDSHINIDITKYNIKSKKIDKNIKMVFLSDLHNREISYKLKKIIDEEKPDVVIFGGDMVNERINKINSFIKLNSLLKNKKYYVYGNHECKMSEEDYKEYNNKINKLDVIVLNNKNTNLSKNIKLYGFVSDIEKYKRFGKLALSKKYIEEKIGKFDKNNFNILVAHNPLEFNSYVDTSADLVLSGHVHGGEIKLPLIGALFSPDYTLFPRYYEGIYTKNNTSMIVSRGIGYSERLPIRILNKAEVIVINLMKE